MIYTIKLLTLNAHLVRTETIEASTEEEMKIKVTDFLKSLKDFLSRHVFIITDETGKIVSHTKIA